MCSNREDDADWPQKSVVGKQELEIKSGNHHVSFELGKLGSLVDVQNSDSPESLRVLYYLIQDLRVRIILSVWYYRSPVGMLTCIPCDIDVRVLPNQSTLQDQAYTVKDRYSKQ